MATIYSIEFIRRVPGRVDPDVLDKVNAGADYPNLDAVKRHAEGLPRPDGTDGFQIRENDGPVRYTMMF